MAYTDPETVRLALSPDGSMTDQGSAAQLSDTALDAKITDAQNEVDAKLAGRYTVPFADPAPSVVESITTAIAAYLATLTLRRSDPLPQGDPTMLAYQRAESMLTQLQSGAMSLSVDSAPSQAGSAAVVNAVDDMFSADDFPVYPPNPYGWPSWQLAGG